MAAGTVVADDAWVALESLATAENAVADEVLGLAEEGRLAVVLGAVPAEAEVYVVADAQRLDLEELAGRLQQAPEDAHVVIAGDPDALPGAAPGAALRDLVAWGGVPVRDLRPDPPDGPALHRLGAAIRRGELLPPDPEDRSVVVTVCADDDEVLRRVGQLVTDSIPRVFGLQGADILVVTPLHRGAAGREALTESLAALTDATLGPRGPGGSVIEVVLAHELTGGTGGPGVEVVLAHELAGRRAAAVIACFPGQAAGVLTRALVYSSVTCADQHLSVVTAAGDALPGAVADAGLRERRTRLGALLAAGA